MPAMTRHAGPFLVVIALLGLFGARWMAVRQAEALVSGEGRARAAVASLAATGRAILAEQRPLAGLHGELAAAVEGLEPLPGLGSAEISYARDPVYMYGFASRPHRDPLTDAMVPGFVLRAWPLRFGVTGDLEYHVDDAGPLWTGQNRTGRSGTTQGFPPPFPDPVIGTDGAPWWPADEPPHR
jgi:hypothetical protein